MTPAADRAEAALPESRVMSTMLPFSPPIVKRLSSLQKGTPKNEAEEKWSEKAIKVRIGIMSEEGYSKYRM